MSLSRVKVNVMCHLGRAEGAQTASETLLLDVPECLSGLELVG